MPVSKNDTTDELSIEKSLGKKGQRYRLYREHKFLRATLSDLENNIARADFTDLSQVLEIKNKMEELFGIMEGHAKHENEIIHALLRAKGSPMADSIEADHKSHMAMFQILRGMLAEILDILVTCNEVELIAKSYEFYIAYRKFIAFDLQHINEEETVIMPELQKYYSDKELKEKIDFPVYEQMSSDDMVGMMMVLFPHMNIDDKEHFLSDLQESQPEKCVEAWQGIAPRINHIERSALAEKLQLEAIFISEAID